MLCTLLLFSLTFSLMPVTMAQEQTTEGYCDGYLLFTEELGKGTQYPLLLVHENSQAQENALKEKAQTFNTENLAPLKKLANTFSSAEQRIGRPLKIGIRRAQIHSSLNQTIEKAKGILSIRPESEEDQYFETGPRMVKIFESTLVDIDESQAETLAKKGIPVMCNFKAKAASDPVDWTLTTLSPSETTETTANLAEKALLQEQENQATMPRDLIPEELQNKTGRGVTIAIVGSGIDYTHPEFGECTQEDFPEMEIAVRERKSGEVSDFDLRIQNSTCPKIPLGINTWGAMEKAKYRRRHVPEPPAQTYHENEIMDDYGYDTGIASIATGKITGIAPESQLYVFKATDDEGYGSYRTIMFSLEWASDPTGDLSFTNKADLIIVTFNFKDEITQEEEWQYDGIKAVARVHSTLGNSLYILGSGDDGENQPIQRLAGNSYTLTAGTLYDKDYTGTIQYENCSDENPIKNQIPCYNQHGPVQPIKESGQWGTSYLQGRNSYIQKPDIMVPANFVCGATSSAVQTQDITETPTLSCPAGLEARSGTNVAAAITTGIAALIKRTKLAWNNLEIKMALQPTAEPLEYYTLSRQGFGVIKPEKAIEFSRYPPTAIIDGIVGNTVRGLIRVHPKLVEEFYMWQVPTWPGGPEKDSGFKNYTLELSKGLNFDQEITILIDQETTMPKIEIWNMRGYGYPREPQTQYQNIHELGVDQLEDGFYTLRLTVENNYGEKTMDYLHFAVRDGRLVDDATPILPPEPKPPSQQEQETTALKAKEYGFDKVLLAQDFGSVTKNTCSQYFCNASQLTISLLKSAAEQSGNIEQFGEITLVETQAYILGDYYSDSFKNNFIEKYQLQITELEEQHALTGNNLLEVGNWNFDTQETESGLYSVTLTTTKTETGYENTTVSLSKLKSLGELDSEQGTKYSKNVFLKKRNSTPLVDKIKGESIPAYASEETIQPLSTDSLGIGIIQTYQYTTPAELQDGTIIHLKLEQEGENPLYKLYYKESYPLKFQTQASQPTELYYALFEGDTIVTENTEETYGENIDHLIEWRKGTETINTTLEETTACNQPENKYMEHLTAEDTATGITFVPNGTTIGFTCSQTDTTITPTHYTEREPRAKTPLQLTGETWYGQGGNTVQIASDDMTSLQHYINLLKEPENKYINFTATETEFKMYWNKEKIMKIA